MVSAMGFLKKALGETVGRLLFRELRVTTTRAIAARFRRIDLASDELQRVSFGAGDKIQLMVGDGETRTFSPFAFDGARGAMSLLVHLHGEASPGALWGKQAAVGDRVRAFGPRGSLPLTTMQGPVVLFGDETSFGVARALLEHRGDGRDLSFVFETTDVDSAAAALEHLELPRESVVALENVPQQAEAKIRGALERHPNAHLVLTGRAPSIQALRAAFKQRPMAHSGQRVRAYWAPGKRGLD